VSEPKVLEPDVVLFVHDQALREHGGVHGLVMFGVAFFGLRELAPALRDQIMMSERDRMLVELRAKGLDVEATLRRPWRQVLHLTSSARHSAFPRCSSFITRPWHSG